MQDNGTTSAGKRLRRSFGVLDPASASLGPAVAECEAVFGRVAVAPDGAISGRRVNAVARGRCRHRAALRVALSAVALALTACASPDGAQAGSPGTMPHSSSTSTSPEGGMRTGVFPTTRVEPPTGADRPDSPAATPDDELTAAELAALVRLDASAEAAAERCAPDDVHLSLRGFDGAAGHRYAQILATNVSGQRCTLLGWPGMGFRGEWGTAFPLVAEHDETPSDRGGAVPHDAAEPIALGPDGGATADLEWTGARAGATEEKVSLMVVQLVHDGAVASLLVPAADHVDIGEATTVRVRKWVPAS